MEQLGGQAQLMEEAAVHQKAMDNAQQLLETVDLGRYLETGEVVAKGPKASPPEEGTQDPSPSG